MKQKGLIFSIDALFAVFVIIAASVAFLFLVQKADSELFEVQMQRITADDNAMVGFYFGKESTVIPYVFLSSKSTAYCARNFQYQKVINTDLGIPPVIASNDFCEGN